MNRNVLVSTLFSLGLVTSSYAAPVPYTVDKGHSSVTFKIRHLLSKTMGTFDDFDANIQFEAGKLDTLKVEATVPVKSINTKVEKRDDHLRSPDFFDVGKFPNMTFKSSKVTDVKDNKAKLHGDLTIHGVTKPVTFDLEYFGNLKDPWGTTKAAFTATTKINRKDFGLAWNQALETGQVVVGEDVDIELNIEANEVVKKADEKKEDPKKTKKKS